MSQHLAQAVPRPAATRSAQPAQPRGQRRAADTALATLAAAGAVGEAVVHVPVIEPHLTEAPYIGVGFILLAVTGILLGVCVLQEPGARVWAATGMVATAALVGYFLSRTTGLPQLDHDVGHWGDPLGLAAVLCEFTMLLATIGHFAWRVSRE